MHQINVLIIDDSAVVRQVMTAVLAKNRLINVIGAVADPIFAMKRMQMQWPDVIVLDIEMPRMDGVTFLRKLMTERPTPVVVCSTLTTRGAETTMQALAAGAFTVVEKPRIGAREFLLNAAASLTEAIKSAARANLHNLKSAVSLHVPAPVISDTTTPDALTATTETVVAIGTSTGGTQALEAILSALPRVTPGLVVVQHMPEQFTTAFAQRLNTVCQMEVREAHDNDRVLPGLALIAPGGKQMTVKRSGAFYYVEVKAGPPVNHHCPSVDVLFRSVAKTAGKNALGIIMTGMGADGARGLKQMHEAGARTLAQDEATCVVFSMPKEAIKLDAVDRVLPLVAIPKEILNYAPYSER